MFFVAQRTKRSAFYGAGGFLEITLLIICFIIRRLFIDANTPFYISFELKNDFFAFFDKYIYFCKF